MAAALGMRGEERASRLNCSGRANAAEFASMEPSAGQHPTRLLLPLLSPERDRTDFVASFSKKDWDRPVADTANGSDKMRLPRFRRAPIARSF